MDIFQSKRQALGHFYLNDIDNQTRGYGFAMFGLPTTEEQAAYNAELGLDQIDAVRAHAAQVPSDAFPIEAAKVLATWFDIEPSSTNAVEMATTDHLDSQNLGDCHGMG